MNMLHLVKFNFILILLMLVLVSCGNRMGNMLESESDTDKGSSSILAGSSDPSGSENDEKPGSITELPPVNEDGSKLSGGSTVTDPDNEYPNGEIIPGGSSNVEPDPDPDPDPDPEPEPEPEPNPNAGLILSKNELNMQPQTQGVLTATFVPEFEDDDMTLTWKSDREDIVSVDKNGNILSVGPGVANITCSDASGKYTAVCTVTVKLTWQNYSYDFKADLSAYEWAMNPESDAYVFLVNKDNPIGRDYKASDLVSVRDTRKDGRDAQKLRKIAEEALHALFIEAEANGMLYLNKDYGQVLSVTSGYRSYDQQERNFNNKVNSLMNSNPGMTKAEAEKIAAETINRPGTSEHQTGLCLDMHNLRTAERELAVTFGENDAGKWLAENCYKFGYILRYEADKTDITGIAYESWHFRYVGRYHATRMHELDMCLEEYTVYLSEMEYEFDLAE